MVVNTDEEEETDALGINTTIYKMDIGPDEIIDDVQSKMVSKERSR